MADALGQMGHLRAILTDYQAYLGDLDFIRADLIFQGLNYDELRRNLFELDAAWLKLVSSNHTVLRGCFPEYEAYMDAMLRGKETQVRRLKADIKLSEVVLNTPAGQQLLADSVTRIVREIEAQGDSAKAEWDSKSVASKLQYVANKIRQYAGTANAADDLVDLIQEYLEKI